jgi:hypothetical protein
VLLTTVAAGAGAVGEATLGGAVAELWAGGAEALSAAGFGFGRTWTVRRTTSVRAFGCVFVATGSTLCGSDAGFDASANPASPPSPRIVAPAAIFILMLVTITPFWSSFAPSTRLCGASGKRLARPGQRLG